MQLSQKRKKLSPFFFFFFFFFLNFLNLDSILNISEKKITLIANVFLNFRTPKKVVR